MVIFQYYNFTSICFLLNQEFEEDEVYSLELQTRRDFWSQICRSHKRRKSDTDLSDQTTV